MRFKENEAVDEKAIVSVNVRRGAARPYGLTRGGV
jgi:hypothetical protein